MEERHPGSNVVYLADHPQHLPVVARWQHAEFGYLNPSSTLDDRVSRLGASLQTDALPLTMIAMSDAPECSARPSSTRI